MFARSPDPRTADVGVNVNAAINPPRYKSRSSSLRTRCARRRGGGRRLRSSGRGRSTSTASTLRVVGVAERVNVAARTSGARTPTCVLHLSRPPSRRRRCSPTPTHPRPASAPRSSALSGWYAIPRHGRALLRRRVAPRSQPAWAGGGSRRGARPTRRSRSRAARLRVEEEAPLTPSSARRAPTSSPPAGRIRAARCYRRAAIK